MFSQDSFRDYYSELRKRAMSLRDLLCERERVSASKLASLSPTHKGCPKAAWHSTKDYEKYTKQSPYYQKKDNTVRLPEASHDHDCKRPKGNVFSVFKREGFSLFSSDFRSVGWQHAAAGCVEGGMPCSHEQTDSDATGIDAKGIIQRFRNPEKQRFRNPEFNPTIS